MGVYTRFKKAHDGLRLLVELLETTPGSRRQKMIDVGMEEDPEYTQKALQCMFTFKDIMTLPDFELTQVISETNPELVGYAIQSADEEVKMRFLRLTPPKMLGAIREAVELPATPLQMSGAQVKMVQATRKLEKRGIVKTKRIPS
ncbi:MAG: FliG C-terminal domain-containing protein [Bdellovibrionia bacterium]